MPPVRMRGDGRKAKNPKQTFVRLLKYMLQYKLHILMVLLCIFLTAFASTTGSTALGDLVDDYILPMVAEGSTDFGPMIQFLGKIACIPHHQRPDGSGTVRSAFPRIAFRQLQQT